MAVRKQDGTLLYAESVVGGAPFTSDYTMHKLNHALESATPVKKRGELHEQNLRRSQVFNTTPHWSTSGRCTNETPRWLMYKRPYAT